MLTSIIKATRAHYAALQHKPSPDRVALDYEVPGHTAGTIWVKVNRKGGVQAERTKLLRRLADMFPESRNLATAHYRMQHSEEKLAPKGLWKSNYGRFNGEGV